MDLNGAQYNAIDFNGMNGIQWTSTESIELNVMNLASMEFKAIQWNSKESMEFNDIQRISGIQCSSV